MAKVAQKKLNIETIDWTDLKELSLMVIQGKSIYPRFNLEHNARVFAKRFAIRERDSWFGYSVNQLERWLTEGFSTPVIADLSEFNPPIREKRKLQFSEEGDEFHYDMAVSGEDKYFSEWTKRDTIPGVSLEIEIGFAAATNAEIVNAYNAWTCKVAYSLEAVGIDTEIMLNLTCDAPSGGNLFEDKRSELGQTRIVVKRENEATDFVSFSAMLSPAAVRTLGFASQAMHCDRQSRPASSTHGYWDTPRTWGVKWEPELSKLRISCTPYHAHSFPEELMNQKLIQALKEMMGKSQ